MIFFAVAALLCALPPLVVFLMNFQEYVPPPRLWVPVQTAVSVLIPARNEAHGIAAAVRSVQLSTGVELEIIVMDDASTDDTAKIVREIGIDDPRVHLESAPPLPAGWNGKQHACWALANAANYPVLCFVDADVRLEPECLSRMLGFLDSSGASLVSGFPQQITKTMLEWLLLPLIHFVLLGFLPISRMRATTEPAFAAGCGQFLMVKRDDYFKAGGHPAIRETMHDGLRLPRLMREKGFRTDLADITPLAQCRMYTNATQVWMGLAKNATEGLAEPTRIVPITILLFLGQIVPFLVFGSAVLGYLLTGYMAALGADVVMNDPLQTHIIFGVSLAGVLVCLTVRMLAAMRFRQSIASVLLHPMGIAVLLAIQWYSLLRKKLGSPVKWKDRAYAGE